jgi:hypothetical protein
VDGRAVAKRREKKKSGDIMKEIGDLDEHL